MKNQHAFTLVELSIVLVILGLLVGGVLTGQSLIHAAELRSVSTQEASYITAVQTFRDKYFAIPGDITNATAYWGAADGSTGLTSACATTASTTPLTCNGTGDGKLTSSTPSHESFRFWQHLTNASLIEGRYDGVSHGSGQNSATTANSPAGKINASLWYASTRNSATGSANVFNGTAGNFLLFGGITANTLPQTNILKPEDAYNLDKKLDDGKPATGLVTIRTLTALSECTDTTDFTNMAANYLLTASTVGCSLMFVTPF